MARAVNNKFFETRDYSMFKKIRGNRPVDEAHVKQLKKLIADNPKSKVVTVKHSYMKLLEHGIKPWACVVLDPRPITGKSTHGI